MARGLALDIVLIALTGFIIGNISEYLNILVWNTNNTYSTEKSDKFNLTQLQRSLPGATGPLCFVYEYIFKFENMTCDFDPPKQPDDLPGSESGSSPVLVDAIFEETTEEETDKQDDKIFWSNALQKWNATLEYLRTKAKEADNDFLASILALMTLYTLVLLYPILCRGFVAGVIRDGDGDGGVERVDDGGEVMEVEVEVRDLLPARGRQAARLAAFWRMLNNGRARNRARG